MRKINQIVIHCSDTPASMDIGAITIRKWHTKERGWSDIGYHFVIRRNGTIENGRAIETIGAHVGGHNINSIGVCWVGGKDGIDNRTNEQKESLFLLLSGLIDKFPNSEILGHRDFEGVKKYCPSFDAKKEYEGIE